MIKSRNAQFKSVSSEGFRGTDVFTPLSLPPSLFVLSFFHFFLVLFRSSVLFLTVHTTLLDDTMDLQPSICGSWGKIERNWEGGTGANRRRGGGGGGGGGGG